MTLARHLPRFFTQIFLIVISTSMTAETMVRGVVLGNRGKEAVEFANVGVYGADKRLVGACASGRDGTFELTIRKDGEYRILITHLGYGSWNGKVLCKGEVIDLGRVRLKEEKEEIDAAGISAKTLVKRESDRIVYDVSADPDAGKMNMMAFMSKVPDLRMSIGRGDLEYDNVQIGKILIDDKDNGMINKSRQYPMNFIKADYMSKIEVILPGSPEYGNQVPILVIRLAKALPFGAATQLKGRTSSNNSHEFNPDAVVHTPIVGVGLKYAFNYEDKPSQDNKYSRTAFNADGSVSGEIDGSRSEDSDVKGHSLNVNIFRDFLNGKVKVSASLGTSRQDNHERSASESVLTLPGGSGESTSTSSVRTTVSPFRLNAGLKASYEWGRSNTLTLKYTTRNSASRSEEAIRSGSSTEGLLNQSSGSNRQQNISSELRFRNKKRTIGLNFETGYMFRDYEDKTAYWNGDTGGMNYTQGVAYTNAVLLGSLFKQKLGYSAAFNAERITNRGVNLLTSKSLDYDETNFIPQLSLSWRFLNVYRAWTSYTCRSRRPRQDQLDPYMDTSDPYNIKTGNPGLKGEINHSFSGSIDRNFKAKWIDYLSVNADYSITPNSIEIVSKVNDNNVRTTSYENIGEHSVLSISLSGAFKPVEIFNINFKASYNRAHYQVSGNETNNISTFSLTQSSSLNMKFAYLSQSLIIFPAGLSAQSKSLRPEPLMDISISKYWEKAHFGGTIGVEDALHSRSHRKSTLSSHDFLQESWIQRTGRKIYISVYWRIGKFKQTETVKHTSYDLD